MVLSPGNQRKKQHSPNHSLGQLHNDTQPSKSKKDIKRLDYENGLWIFVFEETFAEA
ncbi:hypothetical protein LguiB_022214 [Lonicera macranthoides]